MLAAAGQAASARPPAPPRSCRLTAGVDHISVRVSDLKRSAGSTSRCSGLRPWAKTRSHNILRLGRNKRVIVSLRQDTPHGQIDHFALAVENFNKDAATRFLTQRGLKPQEDWEYGYHIKDPDGAVVQMLIQRQNRRRMITPGTMMSSHGSSTAMN